MLAVASLCILFFGCASPDAAESEATEYGKNVVESEMPTQQPQESESEPPAVPDEEVELVAKVLRGECYDDQTEDKRGVARVICNRVSAGRFGNSIKDVVTAPSQFAGYRESNTPTDGDYEIAREVLSAWYASGCVAFDDYLYFSSGAGHKNVFRSEW
jgi:hypothetical protein